MSALPARMKAIEIATPGGPDVLRYEVMYQGSEGEEATFGVRYSMDFYWSDGKVERERNISECYKVRRRAADDRWTIVRNDDYQQRICYR